MTLRKEGSNFINRFILKENEGENVKLGYFVQLSRTIASRLFGPQYTRPRFRFTISPLVLKEHYLKEI